MSQVENYIRNEIKTLMDKDPLVHMNVSLTRPKLSLKNVTATIVGVYPHIFQIEEDSSGALRTHTLQYADIITNQISILELDISKVAPNPKR